MYKLYIGLVYNCKDIFFTKLWATIVGSRALEDGPNYSCLDERVFEIIGVYYFIAIYN